MNKFLSLMMVVTGLAAANANAAFLGSCDHNRAVEPNGTISLRECRGTLSVKNTTYGVAVTTEGNSNCTYVLVYDGNNQLVASQQASVNSYGVRVAYIPLDVPYGTRNAVVSVIVRSQTGVTQDTVRLVLSNVRIVVTPPPPPPPPRPLVRATQELDNDRWDNLARCGGTVSFIVENGNANLEFKDVVSCGTMKVYSLSGQDLGYSVRLDSQVNGLKGGVRTLPRSVMSASPRGALIALVDWFGAVKDVVRIEY